MASQYCPWHRVSAKKLWPFEELLDGKNVHDSGDDKPTVFQKLVLFVGVFFYILIFIHMVSMPATAHVGIRGQLEGVGSFLLSCWL